MTASVPVETDFQRLVVEQALALAREVESTAGAAPDGKVLDRCEGLLLTRGRDFLLTVLQGMAQHTADEAVKKGGFARTCECAHRLRHKGRAPRTVVTALGPITVARVYFTCLACGVGRHPADAALGIDGFLTAQATRLVCRAGGQRSFANAAMLLRELCGWRISDELVRQVCHAEADRIAAWRADQPTPAGATAPPTEFQVDATKVNTDTGWRDMKIGVFAWRPRGPAASPDRWDERSLPKPAKRLAFAAVEEIDAFAPRWGAWAERLGLESFGRLSVFADGAEWIWNAAAERFPGHRGTLDFFHAAEHLGATATALFGEGTADRRAWFEAARKALLEDGWYGVQEHVGRTLCGPATDAGRTALDGLVAYLANHSHRLNYRHRLACGEPIGSGLIEGACKQVIGKRMKQTGARWTVPNANRMAELCCLTYSDQWADYWLAA